MKLPPLLLLLVLPACTAAPGAASAPQGSPAPPADFAADFTGATLRFDYHHVGTATEEHISPDGWRVEGPWPGSRTQLVDATDLGKYQVQVIEPESGRVLWSRGFSSIYGEWETTGEAKQQWGSFHESQRFPEPRRPVEVALLKRGLDGRFARIFSTSVDPASRFVDRGPVTSSGHVLTLQEHGPPAEKVDLLIVSEGYTSVQSAKLEADARRVVAALFATEPFARRKGDFNVRVLHIPSAESGISNPRKGVWRTTPLGLAFNAFDSDRYVLTFRNRELREAAAQAPYDALVFLFNERKYGGGGIFNLWSTCAADSDQAAYLFVHEFGHSFAGLADEYYSSQVAYESFTPPGTEPWEPNVTALLDPAKLKWRDLVGKATPLPTPWKKAEYDSVDLEYQKKRAELIAQQAPETAAEALFREVKERTAPMLRAETHYGQVGAFEGAAYEPRGMYRPEADCIMFTRNPSSFCRVCERAVERVIGLYTH